MALLQLVLEVVIQIVFEGLAELGLHGIRKARRSHPAAGPVLSVTGYVAAGAGAGAISLLILPSLLIDAPMLRVVNLIVTPLAAGAAMAGIGAWRRRRDQPLIRLDRFSYGFLFAFAMALLRFVWGR